MVTVRIMFEFLHGPVWVCEYGTGIELCDGLPIVTEDPEVQELDNELGDMFSSYYEFDSHNQACWFDEEKERKNKAKTLQLLGKLVARLEELNDGSFEIEDFETDRVQAL